MKTLEPSNKFKLTAENRLVHIVGGEPMFYTFLAYHPNKKDVVLVKDWSDDILVLSLKKLTDSDSNWYVDFTFEELYNHSIGYFKIKIAQLEMQLEYLEKVKKEANNES